MNIYDLWKTTTERNGKTLIYYKLGSDMNGN